MSSGSRVHGLSDRWGCFIESLPAGGGGAGAEFWLWTTMPPAASLRGLPPSWEAVLCLCWEAGEALSYSELWSEGLRARPLSLAPVSEWNQTKHQGREKWLDFVLLTRLCFFFPGRVNGLSWWQLPPLLSWSSFSRAQVLGCNHFLLIWGIVIIPGGGARLLLIPFRYAWLSQASGLTLCIPEQPADF